MTDAMKWQDVQSLGIRGRGWPTMGHPFDRLPPHAAERVTKSVWELSRQSAGLYVDFVSDAPSLHARCRLRTSPAEHQGYLKYLDLYARDENDHWRWAAVSRYGVIPSYQTPLIENLEKKSRTWRLYLPLTYALDSLEIGLPSGCFCQPAPVDHRPPIVIYGTSIVHGCGHPSRPGMAWPSILARRLDWPLINLGFSGSARMEPALGEILSELHAAIFVIDPLANMTKVLVDSNAMPFLQSLVEKHPSVPFILIEDRIHADAWLRPDYLPLREAKLQCFRKVAEDLRSSGVNVHLAAGDQLIGLDGEGTTDASHPNDLGTMRYAKTLLPIFQKALSEIR